ncbi:MAG: helix-turn-helix domain-containing protein [Lachnospiraceae bacterium]|uniref:response regulator transcription factor n=1 Tax=Clostridium sp. WB02_MRS01 TaxID=2605777 RepID=UPI0012B25B56|nr:helix-turn-helix domain-containing protein [Clostridium sp. WB02_MRS01]MBW4846900.1 helix-turn-helix domain-containing protein [Lachnospiraceae bacterium]MSS11850.1 helix-turn-helix domain-containing protein [Clostridium sp. WB02_MRS01]
MINILVVDDEALIHISIEKLIHSCMEDAAVTHAYNGREMLDCLKQNEFILAYVDIKMPGLSGLESIRAARELAPHTKYYIMTGFNEFEYAKQAVKLKVEDYLMKPLDLKTIKETIAAAVAQTEIQLESQKNTFRIWLETALNGRTSSIHEYSDYYCGIILIHLDNSRFSTEEVAAPFSKYKNNIVSSFTDNGLLLLIFGKTFEIVHEIFKDISSWTFAPGSTCIAAPIFQCISDLHDTMNNLLRYSKLRVILGTGRFYRLRVLEQYSSTNGNQEAIGFCQTCVDWQSAYLRKDYAEFSTQSRLICVQFCGNKKLAPYNGSILSFLSLVIGEPEIMSASASDMEEAFEQAAKALIAAPSVDTKIQAVIHFIQEHYCENLSTADLSQRFGLSANYISNLLKASLGIRYSEFVTQLRLSHARELLISTEQSIKDITSACGYYSQSHFTKLFIEHEGCTPVEYRKKHTTLH